MYSTSGNFKKLRNGSHLLENNTSFVLYGSDVVEVRKASNHGAKESGSVFLQPGIDRLSLDVA